MAFTVPLAVGFSRGSLNTGSPYLRTEPKSGRQAVHAQETEVYPQSGMAEKARSKWPSIGHLNSIH